MKIIFLIEHFDREYTAAEELAKEFMQRSNCTVTIASLHFHLHLLLKDQFDLLIVPYVFQNKDMTYILWKTLQPAALLLNMNWEQNLSKANQKYKRLSGISCTENIYHIVWSHAHKLQFMEMGFYEERLLILEKFNILGQDQFFREDNDDEIRAIIGDRELLFCPLNYNWSFFNNKQVTNRVKKGFDPEIAKKYKSFSKKNRDEFLTQVKDYANKNHKNMVVLRPHPSISVDDYHEIDLSLRSIPNILVTHKFTAWDWVRHSKFILSSWSTVAYDAFHLGKPACLFLPYGIPDYLDCAFIREMPKIKRLDELDYSQSHNVKDATNSVHAKDYVEKIICLKKEKEKVIKTKTIFETTIILWLIRSYIRFACMQLNWKGLIKSGLQRDFFKAKQFVDKKK